MKELNRIGLLGIEVTRRCNQVCENYCMRGQAQNVDMSIGIVNRVVDNIKNVEIGTVLFSGGEPSLGGDVMEYFIDSTIKNNIKIERLLMLTNGLYSDESVIRTFKKHNNSTILFPDDNYHRKVDQGVVKYYEDNLPKAYIGYDNAHAVLPTGLAKTPEKPDIFYLRDRKGSFVNPEGDGQFVDLSAVYVNALGFILNECDGSYENMDKINYGNIRDIEFSTILNDENTKNLPFCGLKSRWPSII